MKTPLAWRNLTENRFRTSVALGGIGFALVLIFMQLGFLGSVSRTATMVLDAADFDIALIAPSYVFFNDSAFFPTVRLTQSLSAPGVIEARPLWIGMQGWLVQEPEGPSRYATMVMGVDPNNIPFRDPRIRNAVAALQRPDQMLFDELSRPEFQPRHAGAHVILALEEMEIARTFRLGTGFAAEGAVVMGNEAYRRMTMQSLDFVNLGFLKIAPGHSPSTVAAVLRDRLPEDVEVWTAEDFKSRERRFWILEKSIGIIFVMGVAVAFLVGLVVVYQVLLSDISNQISEYATLKAVGYSNRQLGAIVLQQATLLSLLGFFPALAVAQTGYVLTARYAGIPILMTWPVVLFVLILSTVMCNLAGLVSLRKVRTADPATLF